MADKMLIVETVEMGCIKLTRGSDVFWLDPEEQDIVAKFIRGEEIE